VNGSGSWPTPTASDHEGNGFRSGDRSTEPKLAGAARTWPTPTATDAKASGGSSPSDVTLTDAAVRQWPTPTAHDAKGQGFDDTNLHNAASGLQVETTTTDGDTGSPKVDLNPRFVEALMGVPQNWLTPSTPVATASYQQWQQQHSSSLPDASTLTCGSADG
jgi:hypothetical protein